MRVLHLLLFRRDDEDAATRGAGGVGGGLGEGVPGREGGSECLVQQECSLGVGKEGKRGVSWEREAVESRGAETLSWTAGLQECSI